LTFGSQEATRPSAPADSECHTHTHTHTPAGHAATPYDGSNCYYGTRIYMHSVCVPAGSNFKRIVI